MKSIKENLCKIFYFTLEIMEKYFTFVCTLSIPTLNPLPFFVISSFLSFLHNPAHRQPFSPIHHRLHPFRHHPSLALFSPAPPITTGSMSSMPLSILKFDFSFSWLFFVVLHFSFFFFSLAPLSILFSWVSGDWVMVKLAFSGSKVDLVIEIG